VGEYGKMLLIGSLQFRVLGMTAPASRRSLEQHSQDVAAVIPSTRGFSFRARNSFDGHGAHAGASRGGLASLNRPTKKSERQLVRRADPRRGLISAAFDGKPSYLGQVAEHGQRRGLADSQTRLPGLTGMVEGFTVRFVAHRRPQKRSYARSACMQPKVGPGGSTRRVHIFKEV